MGCTLVWASDEKEMEEIRRRVGVGTGVELAGRCTGTAVSLSDSFSHRPVCLCVCFPAIVDGARECACVFGSIPNGIGKDTLWACH